jgi:hypothetical protein
MKGTGKMKKRILIALVLVAMFLIPGGSTPALADSPGKVTGLTYFSVPDWGNLRIWLSFDVREVNPVTHKATGLVLAQLYSPTDGWKRLALRPECVVFGKDSDGKKTAVFVVEILRKEGWGQGAPGEHGKWWVRDGGTPGKQGDQWLIQYYDPDPDNWTEYWPVTVPAPDCESFKSDDTPLNVARGNLVIRP